MATRPTIGKALDSEKKAKIYRKYTGGRKTYAADQVPRIVYSPRGVAKDIFTDGSDEILLSGSAGTGKSLAALQKYHLMLSKYAGTKAFMARKTRQSMTNSCMMTFQERVLHPSDKVTLLKNEQVYQYPNGSIFGIVGLDTPEKVMSSDWDLAYVQEATECTEHDIEMVTTRLRYGNIRYQQLIMDCNPDKPTHWLKRRCDAGKTKMMVSKHEDNPMLWDFVTDLDMALIRGKDPKARFPKDAKKSQFRMTLFGERYLGKLKNLSGVRYQRLYLGKWIAAEGVVYENWDAQYHLLTDKELPSNWREWPHYWSIDFGYVHPFVWGDWVENPETGQMYLVNEVYQTHRLVEDHCKEILRICGGKVENGPKGPVFVPGSYIPRAIICDHDAEGRATFERHTGLLTLPAYKNIASGIQNVERRLSKQAKWGGQAGMFIRRDCRQHTADEYLLDNLLPTTTHEEFDGYVWDKRKNLDDANSKKDELPVDKDNHGMDKIRYILAFVDDIAVDPQDQVSAEVSFAEGDEDEDFEFNNLISRY